MTSVTIVWTRKFLFVFLVQPLTDCDPCFFTPTSKLEYQNQQRNQQKYNSKAGMQGLFLLPEQLQNLLLPLNKQPQSHLHPIKWIYQTLRKLTHLVTEKNAGKGKYGLRHKTRMVKQAVKRSAGGRSLGDPSRKIIQGVGTKIVLVKWQSRKALIVLAAVTSLMIH